MKLTKESLNTEDQLKIDGLKEYKIKWYEANKEEVRTKQREYEREKRKHIQLKLKRLDELEKILEERGVVV